MTTIACIGGGRMGAALVAGWLDSGWSPASILVVEPHADLRLELETRFGVRTAAAPTDALAEAESVIVAVKPQQVAEALTSTQRFLRPEALVISIAAGVRLERLEALVPDHPVVRAMPNTPAVVGMAATAIAAGSTATAGDLARAEHILAAVGTVVVVPEDALDAVTGLSGSGPAYLFLIAEAMIEAGERNGLPRETAVALVAQTLRGAAELLVQSEETPQSLRAAVTSPQGTTEAGVAVLTSRAIVDAFVDAITSATERSRELGAES